MQQVLIDKEDRSLGALFSELAGETGTLIRQEIALAQTELTQSAKTAGKNIGFLAVGGAVAYASMLVFTAAIILLISQFIPAWVAALLVAFVIALIAYFMIAKALAKLQQTDLMPQATIETLKEDARWLKKEVT